jgi:hypothetical protein
MKSEEIEEIAMAVKALFKKKCGFFRLDDLMAVYRQLGLETWKNPAKEPPVKMRAQNHFADIAGINLRHALQTYDWENWLPITDDGSTVAGFWEGSGNREQPRGYVMEEGGKYLRRRFD